MFIKYFLCIVIINFRSFNLQSKPYEVGTRILHITQMGRLISRNRGDFLRVTASSEGTVQPQHPPPETSATLPTCSWLSFADFTSVQKLVLNEKVNVA